MLWQINNNFRRRHEWLGRKNLWGGFTGMGYDGVRIYEMRRLAEVLRALDIVERAVRDVIYGRIRVATAGVDK